MPRHLNKKIWPHNVSLPKSHKGTGYETDVREVWLSEHMDDQCGNSGRWTVIGDRRFTYYFKSEEDLTFFLLRWAAQ